MWVYKISNNVNDKVYIGVASDPANRWRKHKSRAKRGFNLYAIHHAMRKHGVENFTFEIIDEAPKDQIEELEKHYVREYNSFNNGYNLTEGGMISEHTEEAKKKMSENMLGNQRAKGYKQSEEHKRKISEAVKKTIAAKKAAGFKRKSVKHRKKTCPHCEKSGGGNFSAFHFDNCKLKLQG